MNSLVSNTVRCVGRSLLLCAMALLVAPQVLAQTAAQIPAPVVLVLKLVSSTHVRPTTGIVISDDGMVIVPAAFVSEGDEIVVMDGGTDILSNARPARTVKRSSADGLAVLYVEGLKRPAIRQSLKSPGSDSLLHFAAFPPAEELAEGAPPLWMPVRTTLDEHSQQIGLSAETPLPKVSGVIIDNCGQLAGLNLAQGSQAVSDGVEPTLLIGDALNQVLASMQISLLPGPCNSTIPTPADDQIPDEIVEETVTVTDAQEIPDNEAAEAAPAPAEIIKQSPDEPPSGELVQPSAKTATVPSDTSASIVSLIPVWLWVVGVLVLGVLIIKGVMLIRSGAKPAILASDEPDTANLRAGTHNTLHDSNMADRNIPDPGSLPAGSAGMVLLEGQTGDGGRFRRFSVISESDFDLVIGRGDAGIVIDAPSISRCHARLQGDAESMTISDMGSSNGTFVRDIPCLAGEIMFIEPQDDILLGDVSVRISILTKDDKLT